MLAKASIERESEELLRDWLNENVAKQEGWSRRAALRFERTITDQLLAERESSPGARCWAALDILGQG